MHFQKEGQRLQNYLNLYNCQHQHSHLIQRGILTPRFTIQKLELYHILSFKSWLSLNFTIFYHSKIRFVRKKNCHLTIEHGDCRTKHAESTLRRTGMYNHRTCGLYGILLPQFWTRKRPKMGMQQTRRYAVDIAVIGLPPLQQEWGCCHRKWGI